MKVALKPGHHEDTVLCDVVPMHACHILLGRPCQSDRKTFHDGFTNRYLFTHNGKKVVLKPITPMHVAEVYERKKEEERSNKAEMNKGASSKPRSNPS